MELNAPICAVVSEVPIALSWSVERALTSLVEMAPKLGTAECADDRGCQASGLRGGERTDLSGGELTSRALTC